jgi:hypothetical protein
MADSAVAVTAGSGTNIDTRTEATNGNHRQVIVVGDPSTNAGVAPVDATNGLSVSVTNASLTVASHAVTNAGVFAVQVDGSALTALQLIDDTVATLGTTTYSEATTKGTIIGAVRRDADTTLVDTTNEIGPLQMDANGRLKVEAFSGETLPTSNTHITNFGAGEYETVAAGQTAQTLGATGATGDYISGILVIPATTSPGNVLLLDNATSITVFTGGATSVSNLVPFFIPLGMISVSGAWKITTGSNVSCIGIGNFT